MREQPQEVGHALTPRLHTGEMLVWDRALRERIANADVIRQWERYNGMDAARKIIHVKLGMVIVMNIVIVLGIWNVVQIIAQKIW